MMRLDQVLTNNNEAALFFTIFLAMVSCAWSWLMLGPVMVPSWSFRGILARGFFFFTWLFVQLLLVIFMCCCWNRGDL